MSSLPGQSIHRSICAILLFQTRQWLFTVLRGESEQLGMEYRSCGDLPWASRTACPLSLPTFHLMVPWIWAVPVLRLLYWPPSLAIGGTENHRLLLYRHALSHLSHLSSCFIFSRMLSLVSLLSTPEIGLERSVSHWYHVPNSIFAVAWVYLWLYYLLMCLAC